MYNHEPKDYVCPFCVFSSGEETKWNKKGDIVYEDDEILAYISPKWWVKNPGNVIIVPKEHVENIYDIEEEILCKIYSFGKEVAIAIKETYECDGVSFRQHNEPAGNQSIWHFHVHVMPRWKGDNLYINHKNYEYVPEEKRQLYAKKIRDYINKNKA